MATLLIGYDLNTPGQDYSPLIARIKELGAWWHYLDSTWLVKTALTLTQVRDRLRPLIDSSDELLVLDVSSASWAGAGFPQGAYDWLRNNL